MTTTKADGASFTKETAKTVLALAAKGRASRTELRQVSDYIASLEAENERLQKHYRDLTDAAERVLRKFDDSKSGGSLAQELALEVMNARQALDSAEE